MIYNFQASNVRGHTGCAHSCTEPQTHRDWERESKCECVCVSIFTGRTPVTSRQILHRLWFSAHFSFCSFCFQANNCDVNSWSAIRFEGRRKKLDCKNSSTFKCEWANLKKDGYSLLSPTHNFNFLTDWDQSVNLCFLYISADGIECHLLQAARLMTLSRPWADTFLQGTEQEKVSNLIYSQRSWTNEREWENEPWSIIYLRPRQQRCRPSTQVLIGNQTILLFLDLILLLSSLVNVLHVAFYHQ